MNSTTTEMLAMLPSWMKIRNDTESQGAGFINAVGTQLYDIERLIDNILSAHHLDMTSMAEGIDVTAIDILYKVHIQQDTIDSDTDVAGYKDGVRYPLTKASTAYNFYEQEEAGVNMYFIDTDTYTIYTKVEIDSISVNGALYTDVVEHSVWGPFDEIGLLLGCPRIPGERNPEYRVRLLDVFQNIGNSTRQGLINFLARSFGIDKEDIVIRDLSDEFVKSLTNPDGTIKAELKEYMLLSNKINLSSSNVYWDVLEENKAGLSYLPMVWDVTLTKWNNDSIQNGIGDTDDIEVIGPEQEKVIQDFTYKVGVEGLRIAREKVYPEHQFKYRLFATGHKYDDGYKPENYKYSVVASELVPLVFKVKAHKNYTHDIPADFLGATVAYTGVSAGDLRKNHYILKDVVIQPGSTVMNPNNRYIEVLANLSTSNKAATPVINSITISYKDALSVVKTVVIDTESAQSQNGNTITTGFDSNTWTDPNPILRVRNDTVDSYNILTLPNGTVTLAHGEYEKLYNSEGDWDDGEKINLRTTTSGTLKLSI